ncbi:hypothetical protein GCK32_007451 [Trichostrongylus colubriformis]|uniref:Sphingomyelin phosphodiesterase C-terminal domain-containing protein n=1 Tax=Trichostrongylus colubriformis TaxID=6319 RepID=A0AAN8FED0_TRICO
MRSLSLTRKGFLGPRPTAPPQWTRFVWIFERTPNFTWFRDPYNEKFLNLTVGYADVIGLMLFGHHHTDTFHLIKDASGSTVQFALMSPAVTPWFSSLEGAGANNPAFRVYDIDESGVLNDMLTYYINLDTLNANGSTPFVEEYSFKKAYNINGAINIKAMDSLVEQLKTKDAVFQTYVNYNSVLWKPEMPQGKFKGGQLCSIEFADYPRYYACMAQYNSTHTSTQATTASISETTTTSISQGAAVSIYVLTAFLFVIFCDDFVKDLLTLY